MLYFIGWLSFLIFFKLYLNFKVVGRENVPKRGAFIFAANHASYLDPVLLGTSLHRSLNYMARDTLFEKRWLAWALKKVHVFPVKRHESDFRAIKESIKILKKGNPLVIFPEGTRTKDGNLKRPKPGAGFIAAKAAVPIVPAYVQGSFAALPRGIKTLKRHPVKVYIGRPLDFGKLYAGNNINRDVYQRISDDIMERIAELKRKVEADNEGAAS